MQRRQQQQQQEAIQLYKEKMRPEDQRSDQEKFHFSSTLWTPQK
jgi:hypothetical protein